MKKKGSFLKANFKYSKPALMYKDVMKEERE